MGMWSMTTFDTRGIGKDQCLCVQISTEEIRQMERDEAWEPTTRIPVLDEDILEVCKQSHLAWHHSFAEGLMFTAW